MWAALIGFASLSAEKLVAIARGRRLCAATKRSNLMIGTDHNGRGPGHTGADGRVLKRNILGWRKFW